MLYFGAWSIYGQKFRPQDMSVNKVSHILYAFGDIGSDGSVISADPWADYQIRYSGDSQESSGSNAYGNVKQLYLLKQKYRNLKTLLSIVQLMSDWGFDGLDIDWEYPENQADSNNFVLLLQACRATLDKYAKDNNQNYRYPLTIAVSAGPEKYKLLNMKAMDQYVDTWNLMAYDYAGSWDTTTGHAANLFYSSANPQSTKFNTDQAVKDYIKGGVSPSKIVLGMPLYGRSFLNTVAQTGGESLVGAVGNAMGSLELSNNMLDYPQSRYSNIRNKMKV
ncbi:unnamed protein product [Clonostachys rosea f. rosea IK726]|uniref:Uncharacterized protein n=1 Tax=Clonostachys rosea f. rosea IK726 TaxID=1349383 RepID=A0ACA9TC91_BIOOC|nr:unnamed protein product [Clonostachys rosea f. rosea IK726]